METYLGDANETMPLWIWKRGFHVAAASSARPQTPKALGTALSPEGNFSLCLPRTIKNAAFFFFSFLCSFFLSFDSEYSFQSKTCCPQGCWPFLSTMMVLQRQMWLKSCLSPEPRDVAQLRAVYTGLPGKHWTQPAGALGSAGLGRAWVSERRLHLCCGIKIKLALHVFGRWKQ